MEPKECTGVDDKGNQYSGHIYSETEQGCYKSFSKVEVDWKEKHMTEVSAVGAFLVCLVVLSVGIRMYRKWKLDNSYQMQTINEKN